MLLVLDKIDVSKSHSNGLKNDIRSGLLKSFQSLSYRPYNVGHFNILTYANQSMTQESDGQIPSDCMFYSTQFHLPNHNKLLYGF